jgi:hypothetical protein
MPVDEELPKWPDGGLAKVLAAAEFNIRGAFCNMPDVYNALEEMHLTSAETLKALEKDNRDEFLMPRILFARIHSASIAAVRLIAAGQVPEVWPLIRTMIEQAWYAIYIGLDPNPGQRAEIWFRRNDDDSAKAKCRTEFTIGKVRDAHEKVDAPTAKELHRLYESAIDLGAHPNQLGVMLGLGKTTKTRDSHTYDVGVMDPNPFMVAFAASVLIAVSIGTLKVFQSMFPERFKIMSIDQRIEKLAIIVNTVSKKYRPQQT